MTTKIRSPTGLEICTLLVINLFLLSTFINAGKLKKIPSSIHYLSLKLRE